MENNNRTPHTKVSPTGGDLEGAGKQEFNITVYTENQIGLLNRGRILCKEEGLTGGNCHAGIY